MGKEKLATKQLAKAIAEAFDANPACEIDFQKLGSRLHKLLADRYKDPSNPDAYVYVEILELHADNLVYQIEGKKYQLAFTVQQDNEPVLGMPIEVEAKYVPITGSFEVSEATATTATPIVGEKTGRVWDIRLFTEGQTASPNLDLTKFASEYPSLRGKHGYKFYTSECVRDAFKNKLFEQLPFVLRSEADHLAFANGTAVKKYAANEEIAKIAGMVDSTYVSEAADGKLSLHGKLKLRYNSAGDAVAEQLLDMLAECGVIPVELSMTANAKEVQILKPQDTNPILQVNSLAEVLSVDPCIQANANGKFLGLAESLITNMDKRTLKLALQLGRLAGKNPELAKLAEAAETSEAPQDLESKVAGAYLAANPPVAKLFPNVADFMKSPNSSDALSAWLDELLKGTGVAAAPEKEGDGTPVSESVKQGDLVGRIAALEGKLIQSNAQLAEAHLEKELGANKFLTEGAKNMLRNIVKTNNIVDHKAIGDMIRDAQLNMATSESFRQFHIHNADERDKSRASMINFIGRQCNPNVKKHIAESMTYNPFDKQYDGFRSLREILRVLDGINIFDLAGFGVGMNGRLSEAYDPTITNQLAFDAMHIVMQAHWEVPGMYDNYKKLVRMKTAMDFKAINTDNYGYFKASDIQERTSPLADYAEINLTGVETVPYVLKDYGALFGLSFKDFVNDNVDLLQTIGPELMNALKQKSHFAVTDLIWNSPYTTWAGKEEGVASTKKIIDTGWKNKAATGATVSFDGIIDGFSKMFASPQLGSGAAMGTRARYLLTMLKDIKTALAATLPLQPGNQSDATSTGIDMMAVRGMQALTESALPLENITIPEWDVKSDETHTYDRWFLMADPQYQECINMWHYTGIQTPLLLQEAAGTGKSFTADAIFFKIHYPEALGMVNPRGIFGNIKS